MQYFASFIRSGVVISMIIETPLAGPHPRVIEAADFIVCGLTQASRVYATKAPGNISKDGRAFPEQEVIFWIERRMPPLQGAEFIVWKERPAA